MRIAFTLIGGKNWIGGYNYLLNLLRVVAKYQPGILTPVLFFGLDAEDSDIEPFSQIADVEIIRTSLMNQKNKTKSLLKSYVLGEDRAISDLFRRHNIDVVFENANFFGRKLNIPAIAWIPDFQHRHMPQLFSFFAYWKRELGFRAQVHSSRTIMLSSEDARRTCEELYPASIGRTHTVHFAVMSSLMIEDVTARKIADGYGIPENFFYLPNQFWKHKNHLLVLEALSILKGRGLSDIVIVASGTPRDPRDSQYFPEVMKRVQSLGLEENFRLLGLIPYTHVVALMRTSRALINPSLYEGWSTTVEEALAHSVPMILSDLSVHREQAGDSARYFDRNSAASLAETLATFSVSMDMPRRTPYEEKIVKFSNDFTSLVRYCLNKSF